MKKRVLVAYASKHGATAKIAERIGQALQVAGFAVDVRLASQVRDLTGYAGIVLGSTVYAGQWRREAIHFLETHEQALANCPVWLFSSGPTGAGDLTAVMKGWRLPESLQPIVDRFQPRDIAFFGGTLDLTKLNLLEKLLVEAVKTPGVDFRHWDMICSWATAIAATLREEAMEKRPFTFEHLDYLLPTELNYKVPELDI
jgi:menaquinone-dependent protoporphyrinogen oxidase